jgi:hypothetical protein
MSLITKAIQYVKIAIQFIYESIKGNFLVRLIQNIISSPMKIVLVVLVIVLGWNQTRIYYNQYLEMYKELNSPKEGEAAEVEGVTFTKLGDNLYSLTGGIQDGDCNKIVPQMPEAFTLILESPGGNLAEGSCIAAHVKLRNVVTVVRNTPVLNEDGDVVYTPGVATAKVNESFDGKVMCASACGLIFLGGDTRYLIGDVYFGIHGPGTPADQIVRMHPTQVESSTLRTAANLLTLLQDLGVEDPEVRKLFIQIPNAAMYWLQPNDFNIKPGLISIATHYKNFWGYSGTNLEGGL